MPLRCSCSNPECLHVLHTKGKPCPVLVAKQGMCVSCAGQLPSYAVYTRTLANPWRLWIISALASDGNSSGCTTGKAKGRVSRPGKKAKVESCIEGNLVHHVWLQLPGNDPFGSCWSCPSSLNLECLASWEPTPQTLWVSHDLGKQEATWLASHCPNLMIRPVGNVFSMVQIAGWLSSNVPVQIVKDMVSMAILAACGGLFADLDIYWLGRQPVRLFNGYWFHLEPHPSAGRRFSRQSDRVTLAILAMPQASSLAQELLQCWKVAWSVHAAGQANEATEQTNWEDLNVITRLWMRNTNDLHKKIATLELQQAIQQPIMAIPWTKNLTMKHIQAIESGLVDNTAARTTLKYDEPYMQPSIKTVAKFTVAVNLWVRQWKDSKVQDWALTTVRRLRAKTLSLPETCPYIPVLDLEDGPEAVSVSSSSSTACHIFLVREQDLESLHQLLSPGIGCALSHRLMSSAYDFLATSIATSSLSRMADEGLADLDLASGIVLHCARGGVYDQAGVNAALGNRLGPARQALQALRIAMQAIQFSQEHSL